MHAMLAAKTLMFLIKLSLSLSLSDVMFWFKRTIECALLLECVLSCQDADVMFWFQRNTIECVLLLQCVLSCQDAGDHVLVSA